MANINIAGTEPIDDPEYRYKMPRIIGKVEGRGNGIKTVIANISELSMSLHREPGEICKFFGTELGAQTRWHEDTERAIVNGAHTDVTLQQLVHKYIELFVLCPNCRLPESKYKIKNGNIFHKCYACGCKDMVDMTHKLTTYIVNADKKAKKDKAKEKGKDKDKDKKKDKKDKKKDKERGDEEDVSKDGASSKEKKKKDKDRKDKDKKPNGSSDSDSKDPKGGGGGIGSEDDDDEEEAATLDNLEVDDAGAFDNSVQSIRRFLDENASTEVLLDELRTAQTFAAFPPHYRLHLYVASVFAGASKVTKESVSAMSRVLSALMNNRTDQRHCIAAFELLCVAREPALASFFPVILKLLYDADIVEEEAVLAWARDAEMGSGDEFKPPELKAEQVQELRRRAQPFITWLEEAEEEDDDDDDDDDDEEEEEEEEEEGE